MYSRGFGTLSTAKPTYFFDSIGQSRRLSDVGMSASPPIVLQNYFRL
jgi:hypothetical protein